MPDTLVDTDILRAAVQLACRAPSLHNSQPWQWVAEGAGLHLYVDHSRILPSTDKSGREAHISCGAVLDHLRVAMAAAGWTANVDRFPDRNNLDHLASLDFSPMSLVTDGHRRRADAIPHRRTDRLPFAAPRNWESLKPMLRDAIDAGTVQLDVIADELRPELARASQLTNRCDCTIPRTVPNYTGGQAITRIRMGFRAVHWCRRPKMIESKWDGPSRLALTTSGRSASDKTSPQCWFSPPTRTPAMTPCGAAKRCPRCCWSARWPGWRHAH